MSRASSRWDGPCLAAAYLAADLALLPLAGRHLAFCLSADTGRWAPTEFAHPLYVPLLAALGRALALLGRPGPILPAAVAVNAAAGAACVWLYYELARKVTGLRGVSALAALLFAFSHGFWIQHIRPMPYALSTAALLAAALAFAARPDARRTPAWLGLLTGAASGLSLAGLAWAPGFAFASVPAPGPGRWRRPVQFAAAAAAALAAGFFAFFALHRLDPRSIQWGPLYYLVEQVPRSGLVTSRDLAKQAGDFTAVFVSNFGSLWLAAAAALACLGGRPDARERRLFAVLGAVSAGLAAFFLVFNSNNALVLQAGAFLPLAAARGAASAKRGAAALLLLTTATIGAALHARASSHLPLRAGLDEVEPAAGEVELLSSYLRPGDLLVAPAPSSTVSYLARFQVLDASDDPLECGWPPRVCVDDDLARRVEGALGRGRRVLVAGWESRDRAGDLFEGAEPEAVLARRVSRLRDALRARMRLGRPLRSPLGLSYWPAVLSGRPAAAAGDGYPDLDEGRRLRIAGRFQPALAALERALVLDPALGRAREERGWCRLALGRAKDAERDFGDALALAPGAVRLRIGLALSSLALGRKDRALALCKAARDAAPAEPEAHECLAAVLLEKGSRPAASREAGLALSLYDRLSSERASRARAEPPTAPPPPVPASERSAEDLAAELKLRPLGIPAALALEALSRP